MGLVGSQGGLLVTGSIRPSSGRTTRPRHRHDPAAVLEGRGNLGRSPVFTNTDFSVSHRVRFGESERYALNFDFNVLNVFNEANVLTIVTEPGAINPSIATLGLPASITDEPKALNYVLTNGILSNYQAFLNDPAAPQRKQTAQGLPNSFQGGRQIRLGLRFTF